MTFIFGLNFWKRDKVFAKKQMEAVFENIPSEAIMSFEIGNEVCYWIGSRSHGPLVMSCRGCTGLRAVKIAA